MYLPGIYFTSFFLFEKLSTNLFIKMFYVVNAFFVYKVNTILSCIFFIKKKTENKETTSKYYRKHRLRKDKPIINNNNNKQKFHVKQWVTLEHQWAWFYSRKVFPSSSNKLKNGSPININYITDRFSTVSLKSKEPFIGQNPSVNKNQQ